MPPSAGSTANLRHNLTVIGGLTALGLGAKLSFDEATGTFSAQAPGAMTTIARTFSRDTVTSDRYFADPIREVFASARALLATDAIVRGLYQRALDGLHMLRQTYKDARLTALDAVLDDARAGARSDLKASIELREKYRSDVIVGFSQHMLLSGTNPGVCYSFTLDWCRRISVGKAGIAGTRRAGPRGAAAGAAASPVTLSLAQKTRLVRKVGDEIAAMHADLGGYDTRGGTFGAIAAARYPKFQHLSVESITPADVNVTPGSTGRAVLSDVLQVAFASLARAVSTQKPLFILNLRDSRTAGGHAVGLAIDSALLVFFDSNFGEFQFHWDGPDTMGPFFNDWWKRYSRRDGSAMYDRWSLESVQRTR